MERKKVYRYVAVLLALGLLVGILVVQAVKWSATAAELDTANVAEGSVSIRYTGDAESRVKLQVTNDSGGPTYTYELERDGAWAVIPLTEGDGIYTLIVYEQVSGDRYSSVFSKPVKAVIEDPMAPFLRPNQYVDYTADGAVAALAAEVTAGMTDDEAKAEAVCRWVADHIVYDQEKNETVRFGYRPDLDNILTVRQGICFDHAALATAMLRSLGIPCRMMAGDAYQVYHAWISVWLGDGWRRHDPSLAATNPGRDVTEYEENDDNYSQKYVW